MKLSANRLFSPGGFPRFARLVSAGLLLAAVAFHAAAGQTDRSILRVAAAGVGLPPAGHDFTQLSPGKEFIPNRVLLRFASGVEAAQRAQILNTLGGARIAREYELVPALCLVTLPAGQTVQQALMAYNGTPGILYAEPDYVVHVDATFPNDARFSELWGMNNTGQTGGTPGADIHAPDAWDFTTGNRQIIVAVIDTGVDYTHPDLTNNIWTNLGEIPGNGIDDDGNGFVDDVHGYDFVNNDGDPMDDHGHGTHCSGTIGGEGNNTIGVAGVCWQVRIMGVKFLSAGGGGSTTDAISAVQYATLMGANVMNNSWGGGGYSQALKDAIDAAGAAGIIWPAAAGNSASDNDVIPTYPASYDSANIVAVMATDHNDVRSTFSCFGLTSVDLAAPGTDILSCQPGGGYQVMSGTSMATPHVSGACALLLAANPALSVAQIKQALLSSVDPVVPGLCVSGGRLNLPRALASLLPRSALLLYTNYLSGGNGNGIVEVNECNTLNLVLTNVGAAGIGNISATLVTKTPGVAIAQPVSAYPNIPVGGLGTNLTPFKVSTTPSFTCGTSIDFSLILRSDIGLTLQQFSLPTGVTGSPLRFDNNSPIVIPSPGVANSPILVSNINFIVDKVTVSMFVEESFDYFLKLELIAPDGSTNLLSANNADFGQNYGVACTPEAQRTTFDDDAPTPIAAGTSPFVGSFKPSKPLSGFIGQSGTNINGVWQLRATDSGQFETAAIHCWSLFISPTYCVDGGGQCPGADIAVGMTAQPNPIIERNNLTYSIAVTNNGPSGATNVTVTFFAPSSALFVSASASQGTYGQSGSVVTFNLGPMGPRATAALTVVVLPTAAGRIAAVASAASEQPDFLPGNNSAAFIMEVRPSTADLALGMLAAPSPALVGSTLTYTVAVTNNGPSIASGVTVTNVLPPSVAFLSATVSGGSVINFGNVVIWTNLPALSSADRATATIRVIPTAEGSIVATATVGGIQFDPILANNTVAVTTAVGAAADLGIGIAESPDPVVVLSNLTYVIAVTNFGPSEATSVIVNNSLPPELTVTDTSASQGTVLLSGNALTWNLGTVSSGAKATITIVGTSATTGTLTTTATVAGSQTDVNQSNNSATKATVVAAPFVSIVPAGATLTLESGPVNGAVDPGETVTVILRLRDAGNVSTRNLVATLLANSNVTPVPPNNPQTYGILFPSGFSVGRPFSFTAAGAGGGVISATLQLQDGTNTYPPVSFSFTLPSKFAFANTNTLIVPDPAAPNPPYPLQSGPAKPYPSTISVSDVAGVLGKVTVTLSNLTHSYPGDVNALLVAPNGASALLMSHAGDQPVTGLNLTFDDSAPGPLPASGQLVSGVWQPTAYSPAPSFPANAPVGPYTNALSFLSAVNPNGTWSLYVLDDSGGDFGSIVGGWSLALTMITPVNQLADLRLTAVAAPNPVLAGGTLTYIFSVTNCGPNAASSVAFTNTLPAGATLLSAGSSQGNVITNTASVIALLGTLNTGLVATVTVRVVPAAAAIPQGATNTTLTSTANVTAGENDVNLVNNSVSVLTTLNRPVADVGLSQTVAPIPVYVGWSLTNTVIITNAGPDSALSVVLTQPLPPGAGFIPASSSTTLGTLTSSAGVVTCLLGDLAPNAAATVTIVLTSPSAGLMTNTVSLSTGSYDPATNNNSKVYVATVLNPAPQITTAGALLTYESGPVNGAIDPSETVTLSFSLANIGSLDTANVKATLPASGGVTSPSGPQDYGPLLYGGPSAARSFTFQAAANAGSAVVATLQCRDDSMGYSTNVAFILATPASTSFSSSAAIAIPDHGAASPYPAFISITNLTGHVVNGATVTLSNLTHSFPHDINVLLVSPSGSNVLLMSHTGGGHAVTNLNLTFDDSAAGSLPNTSPLTAGTYKPSAYEGPVTPPGNPAAKPYGSTLSALNGSSANGNWLLYVFDDANGDAGVIASGWSLTLTNAPALPIAYGPPVVSGFVSNGYFHLTVTAQPGFEYIVEGSTNLTSWVSLSTNTNSTGSFTFTDTTTPALNSRFYRALGP